VALVGTVCALVSPSVDHIAWWRDHVHKLLHWSQACKFITLIQPSSAAAERVFSLLANSFNNNQESALKDYIQTSVMLQYSHCRMTSFCKVTQSFFEQFMRIMGTH